MANTDRSRQETVFETVPKKQVTKSLFDLSHDVKLTFNMGKLIPFVTIPVLPNDQVRLGHELFLRFAPLYFPIMHRVNITMHYFYVPYRIIWPSYPDFLTGKPRGWEDFIAESDTAVPHGNIIMTETEWNAIDTLGTIGGIEPTTLFEYMGARQPPNMGDMAGLNKDRTFSALPIATYWKIWDDFYRRPQLQSEKKLLIQEGDNIGTWTAYTTFDDGIAQIFLPQHRNWNLDYFTAGLPEPQLGTEVQIPLIDINAKFPDGADLLGPHIIKPQDGTTPGTAGLSLSNQSGQTGVLLDVGAGSKPAYLEIQAQAATIRQFRLAAQTQDVLERLNRTGSRYRDIMAGFWGVDPMAAVVDYAQFLGSAQGIVNIQDVTATALTAPDVVVGTYAGKAMGAQSNESVVQYFCKEHGIIMGLINIQPRTSYMDTIAKHWLFTDRYDYAWDEFAAIGDETVKNKELAFFYSDAPLDPEGDFSYVPRYSSFRYIADITTGEFKNVWKDWHLARDITASAAVLNGTFLECHPRETDIFAIADGTHPIFCHIWNKIVVSRQLPKFGVPTT